MHPLNAMKAGIIKAELDMANRAISAFKHNPTRGAVNEIFVREILRPYLPANVEVCSGELINHNGVRSLQLDVVVYDNSIIQAARVPRGDIALIPWESVIAVIEVKTKITSAELQQSHINAASVYNVWHNVKDRHRDSEVSFKRMAKNRDARTPIPYYVFGFNSDLQSQPSIGEVYAGNSAHALADEGKRLFEALQKLIENWRRSYETLQTAVGQLREAEGTPQNLDGDLMADLKKQKAEAAKKFEIFGGELPIQTHSIHGICSANREWTHGSISFNRVHDDRYDFPEFWEATHYYHHWHSQISKKDGGEVFAFVEHISKLCKDMSKSRSKFDSERYGDFNPEDEMS